MSKSKSDIEVATANAKEFVKAFTAAIEEAGREGNFGSADYLTAVMDGVKIMQTRVDPQMTEDDLREQLDHVNATFERRQKAT